MLDYKVQLEVFEGPLDLLLYLIKKEEVDIYEVNLTRIATQFIEYVETLKELDLDVAGDFVVMAATLMYIKSRELLPIEQQTVIEGEEEPFDPRWELIRQLVEYKKFKDAAAQLQEREEEQSTIYARVPPKLPAVPVAETTPPRLSLLDLINAVNVVMRRFQEKEEPGEIFAERWTVAEKMEHLVRLTRKRTPVRFSDVFADARSRLEVVACFLALLELIRLKQLCARQPEPFAEIEIVPRPAETETVAATPEPSPQT